MHVMSDTREVEASGSWVPGWLGDMVRLHLNLRKKWKKMENKELWFKICKGSVPIQRGQGQTPPPESPGLPTSGQTEACFVNSSLFSHFPSLLVKSANQRFASGRGGAEHPGKVSEIALLGTVHEHAGFFEGKREEWRHLIWGNLTMIERNGVGCAGGLHLRLLVIWENGPLNKS